MLRSYPTQAVADYDMPLTNPRHLPGLNGLRAIAASLVLFGHVYQIANLAGIDWAGPFFMQHQVGIDMVNLFFVISGFIITWTLLRERQATGRTSLRRFYIRRTLRIWPLYFLLVFLVYFLSRHTAVFSGFDPLTGQSLLLLALFGVGLNDLLLIPVSVLPHYWSLSVEEWFYLVFPAFFKKGYALTGALLFVPIWIILRNLVAYKASHTPEVPFWAGLNQVLLGAKFSSIAIGVIGAFLLERRHILLRIAFHPVVQAGCWLVFAVSLCYKFYIPYIHYEVMAGLYLCLILNVTGNPRTLLTLENRFLHRTGAISYGIYMYQWPLIVALINLVRPYPALWQALTSAYLLPLAALAYGLTYGVAALSYYGFERPILRLYRPEPVPQLQVSGFGEVKNEG